MQSKPGRKSSGRKSSSNAAKDTTVSDSALDVELENTVARLSPMKHDATGKRVVFQAKNKGGSPRGPPAFDVVAFRRALASILADLSSDKNVPAAVRRIRLQEVPVEFQAKEFADIITRIVEERRGPIRRCALAFATGLAAAEQSAFHRNACLNGIGQFFGEVYPELCNEIPRLPAIVTSELVPTLNNVFSKADLS